MPIPIPPPDVVRPADRRRLPTPPTPTAPTPRPAVLPPHPSLPSTLDHYPPRRPHLKPPLIKRTNPVAWLCAACCAVLWTVIILAGIAVLVIYLIFRPRNPRLDIAQATLNAAYLDSDVDGSAALLNADLTLLANFSNPNRKIDVVFTQIYLDLYFGATAVAAVAVDPFSERRGEAALRSVHMVASQVPLPEKRADEWRRQEEAAAAGGGGNGVGLELRGRMRTSRIAPLLPC
ncbi:hypothetical protein KSP40_PGU010815 [Platanthera guangdongensis]|uniref:Late embryogenesis abundant protein LEA-2 subgroup domain-containing protein n=1 Tax=Platanthera guangdongensis TaxID=2320717 RepID=A0ABR2M9Z3_9ASPA